MPSVTDQFLAAFVFENEAHDLFGVDIEGIAIDFGGNFYALAQKEPMTIISARSEGGSREGEEGGRGESRQARCEGRGRPRTWRAIRRRSQTDRHVIKPSGSDDLDARHRPAWIPEKVARVKAAIAAKAKKEAAA